MRQAVPLTAVQPERIDLEPVLIDETPATELTRDVVAPKRSFVGLVGGGAIMAALGWLVVTGGNDEIAVPPSTTVAPAPDSFPPAVTEDPTVTGVLRDGRAFEVSESSPGVLCVTFPDNPGSAAETCHLELESGSGAGVVDDLLVFGYLTAGAESASVRYRSGQSINDGIRIERDAGFFALPMRPNDAYRLQYRNADFSVESEVPLVALRGGPSQSPEAATRDDVPADIAALPFNRRVDVAAEWTDLSEGPMVWSRQPTLIATQPGWGELLLLDTTGTRIERSTPIPSLRLTAQLARPDANYFLGEQVATPDQVAVDRQEVTFPVALVRIDRDTGEYLVRLFPQASTNDEPDVRPIIGRPGWELGPELPEIDTSTIGGIDGDVRLRTTGGASIQLDGTTLLPVS